MAHALARRCGDASDEADHRFLHVVLGPARGVHFVRSADLADHDDGVGVGIVVEHLQHVDVLQAVDGVAPDADGGGLAQAQVGDLCNGLIGQRAGTRHDADAALAVDVTRHDADLQLVRRDDARAVGAQQQRLLVGLAHLVTHDQHVTHGDALGDADDQIQVGVDRFPDGIGSACGRHVDDGDGGTGLGLGFLHRAVDGNALEILAGTFGIDTCHEAVLAIGIVPAHARMELAGLAGDALGDDLGVLVDQNRHCDCPRSSGLLFIYRLQRQPPGVRRRPSCLPR